MPWRATEKPAAGVIDPLQLWGSLTQQFQTIAANAFKEVNDAINEGVALAASRVSPVAKSLTDFAVSLLPPVEEVRSSLLGRLFRRA